MNDSDWRFVSYLLDWLEDLEFPLLSWGVTNEALAKEEVFDVVEDALITHPDAPGTDANRVINKLLELNLLYRVPFEVPPRYRTRFAEALRLTSQLRQLLPYHQGRDWQHPDTAWWQRGPRLVADYRLHTAKRRYPKRDIPPDVALAEFAELRGWSPFHAKIVTTLVHELKLSRFQVDATKAIQDALSVKKATGVIVGAGTGSGKTLSFYLPALTTMANAVQSTPHVHTLALYPRTELLRDQLREALANTERIEPVLRHHRQRPLRIGALYGDTPWNPEDLTTKPHIERAWKKRAGGFVCPFLTCPKCIVGELIWPADKHAAKSELLRCVKPGCGHEIPPGRLALTRRTLIKTPPDLLFTTTEMLNLYSTDPRLGKLLGWTGGRAPRLVLLDEVHTYTGVHGAQVALLLRRWRNAVRKPVTFVGLSATLKEAQRFFSQLTGLPESAVTHIEPNVLQMEEEGREYALALRGDPLSGASLLSTSIQTAMLFGRILDPRGQEGLYGSTGFLFTDDLDVTNRYYRNLRDAEGQGTGLRSQRKVLAGLRSPTAAYRAERYPDGQSWDLVEKIGAPLDPDLGIGELKIGRTSSQDAGVSLNARLIVATASLEVGFNDPRVGLVMQHKAPYDASSFIQRRGRAGRQRRTRPLTIVTLSDYGRDRLTYQAYESLFAPQLTAGRLPVRNRYVLKIQATQVLLDWLQRELTPSVGNTFNVRQALKAPRSSEEQSPEHDAVVRVLESVLSEDPTSIFLQDSLAKYLQNALHISAEEAQAVIWEQPRSLMLAVIPTALRRLKTHWNPVRTDPGATPGALLPEFLTRTLFDPLNLPEVEFELPFAANGDEERLPIARALREAVPGRVSRRYGYLNDRDRTWLPIPTGTGTEIDLDQGFVTEYQVEGKWQAGDGPEEVLTVLRPYRIKLVAPPPEVEDRSQSTPLWATVIVELAPTPGSAPETAGSSSWLKTVQTSFHTHAGGNPIAVRRMAHGADATVVVGPNEYRRRVRYTYQGTPAALGFELLVDAFKITLPPIDLTRQQVRNYLRSPQWRSSVFQRAVEEDPTLNEVTNIFKRGWLALVYFTAFSLKGLETSLTAAEIWESLTDGSWRDEMERILQVLYRSEETTADALSNTRLVKQLRDLSHDQTVVDALNRAGRLLFAEDVAEQTTAFALRSYRDTLAAAVLAATLRLCPDAQENDVILDVIAGQGPDEPETIWLSETSIGGVGVVEQLVSVYTASPQRFWSTVIATLKPNEYEYVDATMTQLLRNIVDEEASGAAATAIRAMREAASITEAERALQEIRTAWAHLDVPPRHNAIATLSTRILRPGSGPETDAEALRLLDVWTDAEQRLGFEVDARVIAYAAAANAIQVGNRQLSADRAFSMLWPRGAQARTHHLRHYQPFLPPDQQPFLDRLLVDAALDERLPRIDITQKGWDEEYQQALSAVGALDLDCPVHEGQALSEAIALIPLISVDRDVLRLYGEVDGLSRSADRILVRVVLREVD